MLIGLKYDYGRIIGGAAYKDSGEGELIFEFKPEIKSFSEVIRKVKVYKNFRQSSGEGKSFYTPIVITFSEIAEFSSIFYTQGIYMFKIDESGKILDSNIKEEPKNEPKQ